MSNVSNQEAGELLIVLVDCTCRFWCSTEIEPQHVVEQLLIFLNCVSFTSSLNKFLIIAVGSRKSYVLSPGVYKKNHQKTLRFAPEQVLHDLKRVVTNEPGGASHNYSILSSGLSRALCYSNRHFKHKVAGHCCARLLCISSCDDDPNQYISVMNAIFSAQRSNVSIDCCNLGDGESIFMQQAVHLTNGVYLHPSSPNEMLQHLLYGYSSGNHTRKSMRLPKPTTVDFRASCFCHKQSIDIGFVCSVCLSIFCEKLPKCITCGSDFEMAPLSKT